MYTSRRAGWGLKHLAAEDRGARRRIEPLLGTRRKSPKVFVIDVGRDAVCLRSGKVKACSPIDIDAAADRDALYRGAGARERDGDTWPRRGTGNVRDVPGQSDTEKRIGNIIENRIATGLMVESVIG
ncbi:hypothetical protein EVAR_54766_1 [Eumeta japonica]|uniref:Uncharacterized protein n=1 Tax=Eumeta variegata TaxID=151549 RepID=A0A4C1YEJ2_EUMVA|nr:hypothetical protein EVAR_54766_1 [Eumeta japonica]